MSLPPDETRIEAGREMSGDVVVDTDVVVVGSGSGGALVACTLAEAGQRVVILEEGKYISARTLAENRPSQTMRQVFREGGSTMAIGVGDTPFINVTMGKAVGGSSVITGGVCFRTPGHVLHEWRNDHRLEGMSEEDFYPFTEQVEKDLHVEDVPVEMQSRSTALFGEGAAKLGHEMKPMRRNTKGCDGCGTCNFGCPHGAKLSVDLTYLPRALDAGARLLSDVLVEEILTDRRRAVGVRGRLLNGPSGRAGGRITVHARRVVIAAGSYHSPLILKKSRVGRTSKQVGRNMTLHPAFRMMALFDTPVLGWKGALQSAFVDAFEDERITFMSVFVPPGVVAATMPGIGPSHIERAQQLPYVAMYGGLVHDHGGGVVRRGPGREPFVTYRMHPEDRAAVPKILRRMGDIYFAAGAKALQLPVLGTEPVGPDAFARMDFHQVKMRQLECSSQHPLGTCRMGSSPSGSVVDPNGQTWDLEGLYVADGSIIPTSLGVNPQITILSMALKVARGMLDTPLPKN